MDQDTTEDAAPVIGHRAPVYFLDEGERFWWCKSHRRRATNIRVYADIRRHCCDPSLGGIMLPCDCIDLTDAEFDPAEATFAKMAKAVRTLVATLRMKGAR